MGKPINKRSKPHSLHNATHSHPQSCGLRWCGRQAILHAIIFQKFEVSPRFQQAFHLRLWHSSSMKFFPPDFFKHSQQAQSAQQNPTMQSCYNNLPGKRNGAYKKNCAPLQRENLAPQFSAYLPSPVKADTSRPLRHPLSPGALSPGNVSS